MNAEAEFTSCARSLWPGGSRERETDLKPLVPIQQHRTVESAPAIGTFAVAADIIGILTCNRQ
jgi:hypothetical protein